MGQCSLSKTINVTYTNVNYRKKDPSKVKETDYKILMPDQTLQKYVDYFWAGKVCLKSLGQESFQYLAPASTSIDLVFFCEGLFKDDETRNDLFQNGIVYGQKSSFGNYSTTSEIATLFGIKLKPSVLLTTLNIPAYEISGQQISVQSLFGYEGEKITEVILTSRTLEEKLIAFSTFLREKLKDINPKYQTLEKLTQTIAIPMRKCGLRSTIFQKMHSTISRSGLTRKNRPQNLLAKLKKRSSPT